MSGEHDARDHNSVRLVPGPIIWHLREILCEESPSGQGFVTQSLVAGALGPHWPAHILFIAFTLHALQLSSFHFPRYKQRRYEITFSITSSQISQIQVTRCYFYPLTKRQWNNSHGKAIQKIIESAGKGMNKNCQQLIYAMLKANISEEFFQRETKGKMNKAWNCITDCILWRGSSLSTKKCKR